MRWFGRVRVGCLISGVAVALGAASIAAPAAMAGAVGQFGGGQTIYQESSPETNDVRVSASGTDVIIRELGPGATMIDAISTDGCTVVGRTATCTGVTNLQIMLGENDDTALIAGSLPPRIRVQIQGGNGADNLTGGLGADNINGDGFAGPTLPTGDDTIAGGGGNDTLFGDAGIDTLDGGAGRDSVIGGTETDTLQGGIGDDVLDGGDGDDDLAGGADDDRLYGESDFNVGATGADTLNGDAGDDVLVGGPGGDVLIGGGDFDIADYSIHEAGVRVDIGAGVANDGNAEDGAPGARDDVQASTEGVSGSSKVDVLTGDDADNELYGNGGADRLNGGAGNDGLEGGNGADVVIGGLDTDSLSGNQGNDTLLSRDGGRDADYCHGGTDTVTADAQDTVAGDCETVDLPLRAQASSTYRR